MLNLLLRAFVITFGLIGPTMAQERILISSDWGKVSAELVDNKVTRSLVQVLPLTIEMRDHLRQEKTGNLPSPLPAVERQLDFSTGTLGLWSSDHFVIYYREGRVPQPGIILLGRATGDVSTFDRPGPVTVRSLEATGFEMGEIDLRIEGLEDAKEGDPADAVPEPAAGPAISRAGDLWQLGQHRVLCASALDPGALNVLMGIERATTVFIDPPYNVPIDGHASGLGSVRHPDFAMASGEMDEAAFTDFLSRVFLLLARHSHDGSIHFICMDWRHVGEVLAAGREIYSELKNICVWAKHNAGMGSFYRSQHELVFVFKHGRAPHRNNIQLGQHGRHRSNVWSYRSANDFGRGTDEGNRQTLRNHSW